MRAELGELLAQRIQLIELTHALHQDLLDRDLDRMRELARFGGVEIEAPLLPSEHAEDALDGRKLIEIVDRGVVDDPLVQEDPPDVVFGASPPTRRSSWR